MNNPQIEPQSGRSVHFIKGHGTGNDFVILPDLSGEFDPSAEQVSAMCDRHFGIGADGLLRVIPSRLMSQDVLAAAQVDPDVAHYFMDYRNADGSISETCGNGIRVFSEYLVSNDLVPPGTFTVGTRAGMKHVSYSSQDQISVNMGAAVFESELNAVNVSTDAGTWAATAISMPNPHCVSLVASQNEPGALLMKPTFEPIGSFDHGANFEFVTTIGDAHIAMRTYERGVGETLSCGSGATAAAAAFARAQGLDGEWSIRVDVLGGTVWIARTAHNDLVLTGPARLVASGQYVVTDAS